MDREKLSKVVLEHLRQREHENRGWKAQTQVRLARWSNRLGTLSTWEKVVIAGAALLIVLGIPAAIFGFASGGGGSDGVEATVPRRPADDGTPIATATPYTGPNATARPIGVGGEPPAPPTTTPEPNREDCDAIRGTPYQSEEEKFWYQDNCSDDEPTATPRPSGPPSQPPTNPPPQPTPTPVPQQGITASQAVALGAQFLSSHEPTYSISASNCSATDSGTFWTVSCNGTLRGCTGGVCTHLLRACVFEQPLLVDYC